MHYVLSDIHGNARRFHDILEQIDLQPEDTLYILGDVIDRHPDGIALLQEIMKMKNVKMLEGNHEYMMKQTLNPELSHSYYHFHLWTRKNQGYGTFKEYNALSEEEKKEIYEFICSLPLYFDVEVNGVKYKLVHASLPEDYTPFSLFNNAEEFAVWERHVEASDEYILVFGHTMTAYFQEDVPLRVYHGDRVIGIDCGCGLDDPYYDKEKKGSGTGVLGRLACLRLEDGKEWYSKETDIATISDEK